MKADASLYKEQPDTYTTGTNRFVKVAAMLLLPILAAAIAACDSGSSSPTATAPLGATATVAGTPVNSRAPYDGIPEGKPKYANTDQPDLAEKLEAKPAGQLPSFATSEQTSAGETVAALYKGAADHYDEYSHIPCYCGCAMYQHPHTSLARCFIEQQKGGEIVYTDHSTTCEKCQVIAGMTLTGIAKKQPLADIRADVFKKFAYTGTWTDTPAP